MSHPTGDAVAFSSVVERVAVAIEGAEFGYSIHLTRLVDDESTYTLTIAGRAPVEYSSHEEALDEIQRVRNETRARAVIQALGLQARAFAPQGSPFDFTSRTASDKALVFARKTWGVSWVRNELKSLLEFAALVNADLEQGR